MDVFGITAQNEPLHTNGWESCYYSPEDQRDFIRDYLGPQLDNDFGPGKKKLMFYDWNKDAVSHWADVILGDAEAAKYIWGVAIHWYSGDYFEQVASVSAKHPQYPIFATEGCNCKYDLGRYGSEWSRATRYAHDMMGDFNRNVIGWTDWNLLLDYEGSGGYGGPNHAGNLCFAQVHTSGGQLHPSASYYVFGQFSRFVPPESVRVGSSNGGSNGVDTFTAKRPDGQLVAVIINWNDKDVKIGLRESNAEHKLGITVPKKSVSTAVFSTSGVVEEVIV